MDQRVYCSARRLGVCSRDGVARESARSLINRDIFPADCEQPLQNFFSLMIQLLVRVEIERDGRYFYASGFLVLHTLQGQRLRLTVKTHKSVVTEQDDLRHIKCDLFGNRSRCVQGVDFQPDGIVVLHLPLDLGDLPNFIREVDSIETDLRMIFTDLRNKREETKMLFRYEFIPYFKEGCQPVLSYGKKVTGVCSALTQSIILAPLSPGSAGAPICFLENDGTMTPTVGIRFVPGDNQRVVGVQENNRALCFSHRQERMDTLMEAKRFPRRHAAAGQFLVIKCSCCNFSWYHRKGFICELFEMHKCLSLRGHGQDISGPSSHHIDMRLIRNRIETFQLTTEGIRQLVDEGFYGCLECFKCGKHNILDLSMPLGSHNTLCASYTLHETDPGL